jgi:hypothetical protein
MLDYWRASRLLRLNSTVTKSTARLQLLFAVAVAGTVAAVLADADSHAVAVAVVLYVYCLDGFINAG